MPIADQRDGIEEDARSSRLQFRRRDRELPEAAVGFVLVLPAVLFTLAILAYPLGYSLWISLHDVPPGAAEWTFVGLANYRAVIGSELFGPTLARTVVFALSVTLLTVVLGLAFASLLVEKFPGRDLVRGLLILPWAMSEAMLGLTFGWIFNSTYGPLNGAALQLGIIDEYVAWFADGTAALGVIAVALTWHLIPLATLLYLGALHTVPEDLLKAARVDGAGVLKRFSLITLPWIKKTSLVIVTIAALNGFLSFGPIYILTGGGPGTDTTLLSWWGYEKGFRQLDFGESAAIFYIMTLLILVVAVLAGLALGRDSTQRKKANGES